MENINFRFNNYTGKWGTEDILASIYDAIGEEDYNTLVEVTVTRNGRAIITMNDNCVRLLTIGQNMEVTMIELL